MKKWLHKILITKDLKSLFDLFTFFKECAISINFIIFYASLTTLVYMLAFLKQEL